MTTNVTPTLADEFIDRLDPQAAQREISELHRLAHDPLRALGSGIPTPRVDTVRKAA